MRRKVIVLLVALLAAISMGFASPANATTNDGIWWSNHYYSGEFDVQAQYHITHNGTMPWAKAAGFLAVIPAGHCFANARVSEWTVTGTKFGEEYYTWPTTCYNRLVVDATSGHEFPIPPMYWMEDNLAQGHCHMIITVVDRGTGASASFTIEIGG